MPWSRCSPLFATVFLDMLGFGIVIPVLPKLVLGLTANDAARSAVILGLFGTVFAAMQFVCSPLLGMLSDRFGRRPVIVLSNAGLGFDFVMMALAPTLGWLFAGRAIAGMTSASAATANAYVADVADPEHRASGFGLVGAAFGLGFILGPAIGGLLGSVNARLPFWSAAALALLNALVGLCVLPESLASEHRRAFAWVRALPVATLGLLHSRRDLRRLTSVVFLNLLAGCALPTIYVLYAAHRYGWDGRAVGISLTIVGVCSAAAQAGLMKPAVRCLGERGAMLGGLLCGAVGMVVFGSASNGVTFAAGMPLVALWGLAPSAAQGLMTRAVAADRQGELQGALGSLASGASLLGPSLFAFAYARSIEPGMSSCAGLAWFFSAVLLLAAATIALYVRDQR